MPSVSEQIVRRFPELERFPEGVLLAFVRETRMGWRWARLTRLLMPCFFGVLTTLATFALIWRGMTWGLQAKAIDAASDTWMVLAAVSYAAPVALGFVVWAATRRRLVWRRVREALRDGWLPGATPKPNRTPTNPRARRRYVVELVAMLAVTASPFIAVGLTWWGICRESRQAREIKPGAAGLNALIATLPPAAGKPGDPVWLTFSSLWRRVDEVQEQIWKEMGSPLYSNSNRLSPAYWNIGLDPANVAEERRAEFVLEQRMAERMLPALAAAGVFDEARKIVGNSNVDVGVPLFTNDQAIALLPRPGVRDTFNSLKFNIGRMAAAIRSKDLEEFTDAFRVFTAAARVFEREPFGVSRAQALSIDAIAVGMLQRVLMSNPCPDNRWLERVDTLLAEAAPRVRFTYTLEAERLYEIDCVCYAFYEPRSVAEKRLNLWYQSFKEGTDRRLGGLDENLAVVNDRYGWIEKQLGMPRTERQLPPRESRDLVLNDYGSAAVSSLVRGIERAELDRSGLMVVCAVEKFKAAHGHYPRMLEELVPEQFHSVPLDPWSGRPFSYKLLEANADEHGRRYLVYTWGNDNIDDGGKEAQRYYDAIVPPTQGNMDYIINYVDRY